MNNYYIDLKEKQRRLQSSNPVFLSLDSSEYIINNNCRISKAANSFITFVVNQSMQLNKNFFK